MVDEVIYNLANLRSPITGIGRYAIEIVRGGVKQDRPITAFINGQLRTRDQLLNSLTSLETRNSDTHSKIRQWMSHIPFARQAYQVQQAQQFALSARPLINPKVHSHNLTYAATTGLRASVTTVLDLSHHLFAKTHPQHRIDFLKRFFKRLEQSNEPIITISQSVKNELCTHYSIGEERVHVTPLAADTSFTPQSEADTAAVLKRYGLLHKSYCLSVGTLEPRKNLSTVLTTFSQLPEEQRRLCPLVLVGPQGWKNKSIEQQITILEQKGFVKRLGFVANHELPALYSSASVFLYPSLYEGFGLPLLEAMQCGCTCITSNNGALAEVAGRGAIMIDPLNTEQLLNALQLALNSSQQRSSYSRLALQQASRFNWHSTVQQTWQIYDSL